MSHAWVQSIFLIVLAIATAVLAAFTIKLWQANEKLADIEATRDAAESERAIKLALGRLEQTVTAHRNSLPCIKYVLALDQPYQEKITSFEAIDELPGDKLDSLGTRGKLLAICLGRLYIVMRTQDLHALPSEAKLAYIREEIWSRLNALEEAATFYTGGTKCNDKTDNTGDAEGQRELRRQICSFSPEPVVKMIDIDNRVESRRYKLLKTPEEISRVCRLLNCAPI